MNVALGDRGRPGLVGSGHAMAENAVDEVQAAQRPAPAAAEAPKKKRGRPPGQSIKGQRRPLGKRSMEKQPAVSEAARLLLDVSDRIPFTAVKSPTPKIWRSFELRAKKAQSTQDVITELLWFSAQLKRGVFSRAWMDAQQSDWIQDCGRCRGADEGTLLIRQLETRGIDWNAVAVLWAKERGCRPEDVAPPILAAVSVSRWSAVDGGVCDGGIERWRCAETVLLRSWSRPMRVSFVLQLQDSEVALADAWSPRAPLGAGAVPAGDEAEVSDDGLGGDSGAEATIAIGETAEDDQAAMSVPESLQGSAHDVRSLSAPVSPDASFHRAPSGFQSPNTRDVPAFYQDSAQMSRVPSLSSAGASAHSSYNGVSPGSSRQFGHRPAPALPQNSSGVSFSFQPLARCASGGSYSSTEMLHGAQTSLWNSRLPTAGENLDEPFGVASEVWKDSVWLFERV